MTPAEKWDRIEAIQTRMRQIDAEWEELRREQNELLMRRVPASEAPSGKLTWRGAEERARTIHELRKRGLTHQAIADELGVSVSLVTYYIAGRSRRKKHPK